MSSRNSLGIENWLGSNYILFSTDDDLTDISNEYDSAQKHNLRIIENSNEDDSVDDEKEDLPKEVVDSVNIDQSEDVEVDEFSTDKMNVLVLYVDDWRWDGLADESPMIKTPFLTEFAKDGIRFKENAVTSSICWQSRATLFTGQYLSRHKSVKLRCPHFSVGRRWNHTWPAILQKHSYFVGHIGKWQYHNNDLHTRFDYQNIFEGFHLLQKDSNVSNEDVARDRFNEFLNLTPRKKPWATTIALYPPKPVGVSNEPGMQYFPKNETWDLYRNLTIPEPIGAMESFTKLPYFLKTGIAFDRWKERYSTPHHYQESMKKMYALITQLDTAFKQIVDNIKQRGLYNNTMIIITADNGMFNGAHGLAGKWFPYRESIRVPLIIYDPRMPQEKRGRVDDSFTLNIDLAETILGAAGLKQHPSMQGRDISDLYLPKTKDGKSVLERKPWRNEFFYEFTYLSEREIPSSIALIRKKWKLIDWYLFNETQLFDLENDPLEITDVKEHPNNTHILREMRQRLRELRDSLKEPEIGCNPGDYTRYAREATPIKETPRYNSIQ